MLFAFFFPTWLLFVSSWMHKEVSYFVTCFQPLGLWLNSCFLWPLNWTQELIAYEIYVYLFALCLIYIQMTWKERKLMLLDTLCEWKNLSWSAGESVNHWKELFCYWLMQAASLWSCAASDSWRVCAVCMGGSNI